MVKYHLYHLIQDEPFYVGVTVNPKKRLKKHKRDKVEYLPFTLEVIYETENLEEIIELEHRHREANPHFINVSSASYSYQPGCGELVGNAVLSNEDVFDIREMFFENPLIGYKTLAKEFNTSPSNIVNVLKQGRQWANAPGPVFNDPKAYLNYRRFEQTFWQEFGPSVIKLLDCGKSMNSIWQSLNLPCHWSYLPRLKKKFLAYELCRQNNSLEFWERPIIIDDYF